ncbi:MAG TPA: hypothetical protein PLJ60_02390 [Chryseolinea sp.]|nr:hypothetical protein [Chryseolinea sp.]
MRIVFLIVVILTGKMVCAQVAQDTVRQDSIPTKPPVQVQLSVQPTAPQKTSEPFMKRISLGGSTGFWWSTHQMNIEVSPLLAYHFPKILVTGFGYRYIYVRDLLYSKNLNNYGPNIFARAQITKRIYLWTEWENLRTEYVSKSGITQEATVDHEHIDSFFAGFGYVRHFGKRGRAGLGFQLLYNFLYEREDHSSYYSPVIYRIGYFF